jgi:hypothetical protein
VSGVVSKRAVPAPRTLELRHAENMKSTIVLVLLSTLAACKSSGVIIRRGGPPAPTTFAGLRALSGPAITQVCTLQALTLSPGWTPVKASDSVSFLLPPGWKSLPPLSPPVLDAHPILLFAGPTGSRLEVQLEDARGKGRRWLAKGPNATAVTGLTCEIDRGPEGAIWTFYPRDSTGPDNPRPYIAFGDVMTPSGRWYRTSVYAKSEQERDSTVRIATTALFQKP